MKEKDFWSKHVDNFDKYNNYIIGIKDMTIIQEEISKLNSLGDILELACGSGIYTDILFKNSKSYLATDLSKEMLEHTKNKFSSSENIRFEQADAMNLKYEEESFDTVFMANLLHIVPDYNEVIKEALKVLKPNGRLITLDFTTSEMKFIDKLTLIYRFLKSYGKPEVKAEKSNFTRNEIKRLFESYNLEVQMIKMLGNKNKAILGIAKK